MCLPLGSAPDPSSSKPHTAVDRSVPCRGHILYRHAPLSAPAQNHPGSAAASLPRPWLRIRIIRCARARLADGSSRTRPGGAAVSPVTHFFLSPDDRVRRSIPLLRQRFPSVRKLQLPTRSPAEHLPLQHHSLYLQVPLGV